MKMNCNLCGKEFSVKKVEGDFSYGFIKGRPFAFAVCNNCKSSKTEEELHNLVLSSIEKLKE